VVNSVPRTVLEMPKRRSRTRESGRLYEIPLLFVGSSIALALVFPLAARSGHPWLPGLVLGVYGAIVLFLFWAVRGWGRMTAVILIGLEFFAVRFVPAEFKIWFLVAAPALFVMGWVVDGWLRKRAQAAAIRPKGP